MQSCFLLVVSLSLFVVDIVVDKAVNSSPRNQRAYKCLVYPENSAHA